MSRRDQDGDGTVAEVSFKGQALHFFGEIAAVFAIWAVALAVAITLFYDWTAVVDHIGREVKVHRALYVVVIMALAGTRPILQFAEKGLRAVAAVGDAQWVPGGLPS